MNVKKSVILAFLVAVGILLQLLESFVGIFMIVPGYKIGLANIAGLFALYIYDEKSLAYVSLLRIFLSSLMQGTLFSVSFYLSLSGGILACIAMIIAYRSKVFSIYGVSILGACFHWTSDRDYLDLSTIFYATFFADSFGIIHCEWYINCSSM